MAFISGFATKKDGEAVAEAFASVLENGPGGGSAASDILYDELIGMLRL